MVRGSYNKKYKTNAKKNRLEVGSAGIKHEYDIYEKGKIIAGVTTSPWKNKSGTNNTGGQDRAAAELLWLSLWGGNEDRWLVFTDKEMAENIFRRFEGAPLRVQVSMK